MKTFTNANPRDLPHALALIQQAHADGRQLPRSPAAAAICWGW